MSTLDETWSEVRTRLDKYVRTRVGVDVSEDLVHDILLRVLQNQATLATATNPMAWIYTIAKNRITDYYRKRSGEKMIPATSTADIENRYTDDSNQEVDSCFTDCLHPLIDQLEPNYKQALILTDLQGLKQADAARQIGISVSGMKSRVQRGRKKLKKLLIACCEMELDFSECPVDYQSKHLCNGARSDNSKKGGTA